MEFPNELQRAADPHWTRKVDRPTRATWPWRLPSLEEAQSIWDAAHRELTAHEERMTQLRTDRENAEAAAAAERVTAHEERQAAKAALRESELAAVHFAAGGTEAQWESEKAEILRLDRQRRTLEGEAPVRSLIDKREAI